MDVHPTKNGINRYWSIAISYCLIICHYLQLNPIKSISMMVQISRFQTHPIISYSNINIPTIQTTFTLICFVLKPNYHPFPTNLVGYIPLLVFSLVSPPMSIPSKERNIHKSSYKSTKSSFILSRYPSIIYIYIQYIYIWYIILYIYIYIYISKISFVICI